MEKHGEATAPTERSQSTQQGGSVVIPGAIILALMSSFGSLATHYLDRPAPYRAPQEIVDRLASLEQRTSVLEGKVTQIQIDSAGYSNKIDAKLDAMIERIGSLESKIDRLTERRR